MKVLLFGGTGVLGTHIGNRLSDNGTEVYITSRRTRSNNENIHYIQGNAKDIKFLDEVLNAEWDVIIDFMVYTTAEFRNRFQKLLKATKQYVFISSARVYSDSTGKTVTEDFPRLLDVCTDQDYLSTDEYALTKARQEDMLINSNMDNWTIIRPGLTYGEDRLQLGVYEKENWLYRALHGRSIVFSKDLLGKCYTLSYSGDVSDGIAAVVGNPKAYGEIFHIVIDRAYKWEEILEVYLAVFEREKGLRPKVIITDTCTNLKIKEAKYQVLYGRYFERQFDNSKIRSIIDTTKWQDAREGLDICLTKFLAAPEFLSIDWVKEAYIDRASGEKTPLDEIPTKGQKVQYVCYRYGMGWIYKIFLHCRRLCRNVR